MVDEKRTPPPEEPIPPSEQGKSEIPKDVRTMAMLCHLLALAGYVIPFGNIIGPLVMWLVKKEDHPFIDEQGKEALNFQITVALAVMACLVLFSSSSHCC